MTQIRLWLARRMAPGGWHVQRDPVRRKAAPPAALDPVAEWADDMGASAFPPNPDFQRAIREDLGAALSDPSLGNGAP